MHKEKRNKVFLITKWYPNRFDPQIGVFIQKHARAISVHSDITVFYAQSTDTFLQDGIEIESRNEKGLTEFIVYYQKSNSIFSPIVNAFRYYRAFLSVWKQAKKPDLVHAYILLRPALIAWWISKRYSIPYVVSEQWSGYTNGRFQRRGWWIRSLSRYFTNHANGRTVVSKFLQGKMLELNFRGPFTVIPNIIEKQKEIDFTASRTVSSGKKILVVADLVDDIKNISGTIHAFREVHIRFPESELRIVGGGRDEDQLKQIAKKYGLLDLSVFFEGIKTNEEVYKYLHACDFLIVNSRFETFSLICAEAMSCGKPVIATRCGGPEEIVVSNAGILIPVDDHIALVQAIEKMICKPEIFNADEIRKYAEEKFCTETASIQFSEVYSQALLK